MNRLMKLDGDIPPNWRVQLDSSLGEGWYDEVYCPKPSLFGNQLTKRDDAISRVLTWYQNKLGHAFGYVSGPRLIRNTRRSPLYFLLWAGPHRKGLQGAKYVLEQGERLPNNGRP